MRDKRSARAKYVSNLTLESPLSRRRVLIVGASRGIGLALVGEYRKRGWLVWAGVRAMTDSSRLCELVARAESTIRVVALDICDDHQVQALVESLKLEHVDLVIITAGLAGPKDVPFSSVARDDVSRVIETNTFAPIRLADAMLRNAARPSLIVFFTSRLGVIGENRIGGWELYRASRAAYNMLVKCFALRASEHNVSALAFHPGWVRTDMGGPNAPLKPEFVAYKLAEITEARAKEQGSWFLDYTGQDVPW